MHEASWARCSLQADADSNQPHDVLDLVALRTLRALRTSGGV